MELSVDNEEGPPRRRFHLFDSLRAIAALTVLLAHATLLSGFWANPDFGRFAVHLDIGVTIFFLISGFLLYRPFVSARYEGGSVSVGRYAKRRAFRIFPAYWLALVVLTLLVPLDGAFSREGWAFFGLLQVYPLVDLGAVCSTLASCGIAPTWSLAVEASFYLLLPFLAFGVSVLAHRVRTITAKVEILFLMSLGAGGLTLEVMPGDGILAYLRPSAIGLFSWFALGMILSVLSVHWETHGFESRMNRLIRDRSWIPASLALGIFIAYSLSSRDFVPSVWTEGADRMAFLVEHLVFGLAAFLLLAPAVFAEDKRGWPQRILGSRTLTWVGLISYGIFLWHFPILLWLLDQGALDWGPVPLLGLTLPAVVLTVIAATLSYYLVERPLLGSGRERRA